jgi:hypothetical protein
MSNLSSYIQSHKFVEVLCSEGRIRSGFLKGNQCNHWLGYAQIDVKNAAQFYCKECNLVYTVITDDDGSICIHCRPNISKRIGVKVPILIIR